MRIEPPPSPPLAIGTIPAAGHRHHTHRYSRTRSTARTANGSFNIPWIIRRAEKLWLGERNDTEFGGVSFPYSDHPGRFKTLNQFAVLIGYIVLQETRTTAGWLSGEFGQQILEHEGHASEGSQRKLGLSGSTSSVTHFMNDSVKLGIERLDAADRFIDQF